MNGWIWKFPLHIRVPVGLKLVQDKEHHYCIAPAKNIPLDMYKGLLQEMALYAAKVYKKKGHAL